MKSNEIDELLNGLLEPSKPKKKAEPAPKSAPSEKPKSPAASEAARRRVEALMRDVEEENSRRHNETMHTAVQAPPRHEPVVQPEPVSHFAEEPSPYPAVRMHDRLDEISLPMLDAERKPNQIIPPKPKQEPPKKKKRPPVENADAAKPQTETKKRSFHIEVPDELPPDIPRDTSIADELRRRRESGNDPELQDEVYTQALARAEEEQRAETTRMAEERERAEEARRAAEREEALRRQAEAEEARRSAEREEALRRQAEAEEARRAAEREEELRKTQDLQQESESAHTAKRAAQIRAQFHQEQEEMAPVPEDEHSGEQMQEGTIPENKTKASRFRHLEEMDTQEKKPRSFLGLFKKKV